MIYINKNIDEDNILEIFSKKNIPGVEKRKITDLNHPVKNSYGLFSTKKWFKFDIIGEYTGQVINKYKNGDYIVGFSNLSFCICLDGEKYGNECRYINHYKNIKDKPNCKYVETFINCKPVILIVVIEDIENGQEILSDYCYDF